MLQTFHQVVTKYLTLFSKSRFQTFSYIHINLRETLKWNEKRQKQQKNAPAKKDL